MSVDYRLTLGGNPPVNQVAERALPDPGERPTGVPPILSVNLYEKYGFGVNVRTGRNGYVDAESDDGLWEWEPAEYAAVAFQMDKFADPAWKVTNMLTIVRRVLDTGPEDAALVLNGDVLIFTRFSGTLIKHNREKWWAFYPGADQLI
jgi:hypothetical protein